jgi:hypothetical protein
MTLPSRPEIAKESARPVTEASPSPNSASKPVH